MKWEYKGKIYTDEELLSEAVFYELSKQHPYPSEEMVAEEIECYADEVEDDE